MGILRSYFRYKWYSQASRSLQRELHSLHTNNKNGDQIQYSLKDAQQYYETWMRFYTFVISEEKGRVTFRDTYIPIDQQDQGHEYQIKRCQVASKMALDQLQKFADYIYTKYNETKCCDESNPPTSLTCEAPTKDEQKIKKKKKKNSLKNKTDNQSTILFGETIAQIQKEIEETEIQGCMDVAKLILQICPDFTGQDPKVS